MRRKVEDDLRWIILSPGFLHQQSFKFANLDSFLPMKGMINAQRKFTYNMNEIQSGNRILKGHRRCRQVIGELADGRPFIPDLLIHET